MKVTVTKASELSYTDEVELNTMTDLLNFIKTVGHSIVVQENTCPRVYGNNEVRIIIYDDYLE